MNPPRIAPATNTHFLINAVQGAVDVFVVIAAGHFSGRLWRRGELLVCKRRSDPEAPVVLVPLRRGRCRLGTVRGTRIYGDANEPCGASRWQLAGQVCAVARQLHGEWLVERLPALHQGQFTRHTAPRPLSRRAPVRQLDLFTRRAA